MIDKLSHRKSFFGVFLQAFQNKIFALLADRYALGKINFFVYNLSKVSFTSDIERDFSINQLIDQNTNIPDVHLIVIFLVHNNLRRRIERSATSSFPE